jgi:hypothetical protein
MLALLERLGYLKKPEWIDDVSAGDRTVLLKGLKYGNSGFKAGTASFS